VLKGLATGVSVVVSTALSTMLFQTPLNPKFSFGATLILASVYFFSNPLPARFLPVALGGTAVGAGTGGTEMKSLLPK